MNRHRVIVVLGGAALAAYAGFALRFCRIQENPERFSDPGGSRSWFLGAPASGLLESAERQIRHGLDTLNDVSLPGPDRMRVYREHLRRAEDLLERSLRANPAQARALADLAAVRWELDPPTDEDDVRAHLAMIGLAARMAPRVPTIQIQLGELLLKMGREDEALDYLRTTIELAPDLAGKVVELLRRNVLRPTEILEGLGRRPETLAALRSAFLEEGQVAEYLAELERLPELSTAQIIRAYGDACLRARQSERLRDRMSEIGPFSQAELEAERLLQRSRAHLALGDHRPAVEDARQAAARVPGRSGPSEHLGMVALRAGDPELALASFRDALGKLAVTGGAPRARARLYRWIGQAEEAAGRPDRAYDAYKRALALDPDEPLARRRVSQMEAAVGGVPD